MKKFLLVDGHSLLYRAYHAFPNTLRTRQGEIVNAVYGFTRMLLGVIEELKPDYLAVAFDLPQPNFRHRLYVAYQYKRPAMDRELADQVNRVKQVVETLGIPIFTAPGFEADDVIGSLARQAETAGVATVIITGDRDMMQLAAGQTKLYFPERGLVDNQLLGVKPAQVVDYKALVGDSSDNYPGVPGVGPKTAVSLLQKYQTLNNVYRHLDKIRPVVAKKLREGQESAWLSRKLAKIDTQAPAKLDLVAARVHDYDQEKARQLFEELQFRSLLAKLPGVSQATITKKDQQMELL
ncbi:hypothetical protein COT66_00875 [Candidatus Shapirobacteria bacterium CG09_land_8_20_14_0_10_49_15]|uniref:5'-3' exonuclease domain-containing protein n=2 Tax=Candidatus Shapironibacteriota TaxID=1752721 RepID=A0A2M8L7N1_9BACT|nr:MAG: hypothetical protein COT66_00875 [Candidatus Shapirobacteria bacterium CG09_land_8_20_14_0_10_49_15]PJE70243.1 MAG: hypothetical protein COU97_00810 [Candidatus Shapirobacteria bacterium CG10_big_fil_rev_8_21_14_0_10_48_15]